MLMMDRRSPRPPKADKLENLLSRLLSRLFDLGGGGAFCKLTRISASRGVSWFGLTPPSLAF